MSLVHQISSGSEGDHAKYEILNDKKKRRMISNRESARRSRMKKQNHLDDLLNQVVKLQKENEETSKRINIITENYNNVETENKILRAEIDELTKRLQSLNSFLRIIEEINGVSIDIPEIPDPLLKPWHLPYTTQSIMGVSASSGF